MHKSYFAPTFRLGFTQLKLLKEVVDRGEDGDWYTLFQCRSTSMSIIYFGSRQSSNWLSTLYIYLYILQNTLKITQKPKFKFVSRDFHTNLSQIWDFLTHTHNKTNHHFICCLRSPSKSWSHHIFHCSNFAYPFSYIQLLGSSPKNSSNQDQQTNT